MPNTCCAPSCTVGYKPKKKKQKNDESEIITNEVHSLFSFPRDPKRRAKWIARVPLDNWNPIEKANIFLCERHFMSTDIIDERTDLRGSHRRWFMEEVFENVISKS